MQPREGVDCFYCGVLRLAKGYTNGARGVYVTAILGFGLRCGRGSMVGGLYGVELSPFDDNVLSQVRPELADQAFTPPHGQIGVNAAEVFK